MASTVSNTTLQFGMLSVPVALRKIRAAEPPSLGRATPDGKAVTQVLSAAGDSAPVERAELLRGVWDGDDFKPIPAEDLEALEEATKLEALEITEFIPLSDVPFERATNCYFLIPQKAKGGPSGAKAMALLLHAMRATKAKPNAPARPAVAGVMKLCLRSKQQLAVVYPKGDGLYVSTLAWSEDWTQAHEADVLGDVEVDKAHAAMAEKLVTAMMAPDAEAALDSKVDDKRVGMQALIDAALAGNPMPKMKGQRVVEATDSLEQMLQESLALAAK